MYNVYFQLENEEPCVFVTDNWHTVATVYISLCYGRQILDSWRVWKDVVEYNMPTAQPIEV